MKAFLLKVAHTLQAVFESKSSMKEQVFFVKRLSFLIRAEVPVVEALSMLRDQAGSKRMSAVLSKVVSDVSNGHSLSASVKKYPNHFGSFAVHIMHIGEQCGTLPDNLEYLAEDLKKRSLLKRKIVSAFVYPVVILCATLGITVFLLLYLFPKIMPVFQSLRVTLPLSTRILLRTTQIIQLHGFALLILFGIFFFLTTIILKKNETVRLYRDSLSLKIPLFKSAIQSYNLTHITRTLSLLLGSGIPLSESLPIVSDVIENRIYKRELLDAMQGARRGETLTQHLSKHPDIFPEMAIHIISVGERSGNLTSSLVYLSDFFEQEVDSFTKNISTIIEPLLMIVMGLLVGFIALSIITPIYGITQNLHP